MGTLWPLDILISIALVGSLYLKAPLHSDVANLISGAAALGLLGVRAVLCLVTRGQPTSSYARAFAALFGALAICFAAGVGALHWSEFKPSGQDIGLYVLQCGGGVLMLAQVQRRGLLFALGAVCTATALADAAFNFAVLKHWAAPIAVTHRITSSGAIERFPGICGNTLGAGLVAMIACAFLGERVAFGTVAGKLLSMAALAVILGDMMVIDSRRYLAAALGGTAILVVPWFRRWFPVIGLTIALTWSGLWFAFNANEPEEIERSNLIAEGWRDAQQVLWIGQGAQYRASPTGTTYEALWQAGVTESGLIDLVIAYGLLATVPLILSILLALAAKRGEKTMGPVLLAAFAGTLAYSDFTNGFLGATAFLASLLVVIFEEPIIWRPIPSLRQIFATS